jgi:hypothetical protein
MVNTMGESLDAEETGLAVTRYVRHISHVRRLRVFVRDVWPIQRDSVSNYFLGQVLLKLFAPSILRAEPLPLMVANFCPQKQYDAVHGMQYTVKTPTENPKIVAARPDGGAPVSRVTIFAINAIHICLIVLNNYRAPNLDCPFLCSVPSIYHSSLVLGCGHQVIVEETNLFLVLPDSRLNLEKQVVALVIHAFDCTSHPPSFRFVQSRLREFVKWVIGGSSRLLLT